MVHWQSHTKQKNPETEARNTQISRENGNAYALQWGGGGLRHSLNPHHRPKRVIRHKTHIFFCLSFDSIRPHAHHSEQYYTISTMNDLLHLIFIYLFIYLFYFSRVALSVA